MGIALFWYFAVAGALALGSYVFPSHGLNFLAAIVLIVGGIHIMYMYFAGIEMIIRATRAKNNLWGKTKV